MYCVKVVEAGNLEWCMASSQHNERFTCKIQYSTQISLSTVVLSIQVNEKSKEGI